VTYSCSAQLQSQLQPADGGFYQTVPAQQLTRSSANIEPSRLLLFRACRPQMRFVRRYVLQARAWLWRPEA
jgi:hypothetical protein